MASVTLSSPNQTMDIIMPAFQRYCSIILIHGVIISVQYWLVSARINHIMSGKGGPGPQLIVVYTIVCVLA